MEATEAMEATREDPDSRMRWKMSIFRRLYEGYP